MNSITENNNTNLTGYSEYHYHKNRKWIFINQKIDCCLIEMKQLKVKKNLNILKKGLKKVMNKVLVVVDMQNDVRP